MDQHVSWRGHLRVVGFRPFKPLDDEETDERFAIDGAAGGRLFERLPGVTYSFLRLAGYR
jgi:hypothetical protein